MVRTSDAKTRAIAATEMLLRQKGYHATGLAEILAQSEAPKGSFYFHFPEGKDQLAAAAIVGYRDRILAVIGGFRESYAGDAAGFIRAICRASAAEMEASNWALGCAVQNVLNEGAALSEPLVQTAAAAVESWITEMAKVFAGEQARRKAVALLCALEGARTLAKASRSSEPFNAVADVFIAAERSPA